jgi:lipopolysaccharide export system protein LptA
VRDEKAGYTVYSGDVVLTQGSLRIDADRLTIFHDREAADRVIAEGRPARMQQQPEIDQALVTARAGRIVYLKSTERVLLQEAAIIEQDGATVTGDSIEYFMAEQRVMADAAAGDADARVQVFIPAEVIEERTADDEAAAAAGTAGAEAEPSGEGADAPAGVAAETPAPGSEVDPGASVPGKTPGEADSGDGAGRESGAKDETGGGDDSDA